MPDGALARLQAVIDRSAATAGPAMLRNFIGPGWRMSAGELAAFFASPRMASVSTTSAAGRVHVAPLEVTLVDGRFRIPTYPDSRRLRDHRANTRCAIASWEDAYHAVIVYGTARELRPDAIAAHLEASQGYAAGSMVTIEVEPTHIYAIRPPAGHPHA